VSFAVLITALAGVAALTGIKYAPDTAGNARATL
jgi:hypothetical protein